MSLPPSLHQNIMARYTDWLVYFIYRPMYCSTYCYTNNGTDFLERSAFFLSSIGKIGWHLTKLSQKLAYKKGDVFFLRQCICHDFCVWTYIGIAVEMGLQPWRSDWQRWVCDRLLVFVWRLGHRAARCQCKQHTEKCIKSVYIYGNYHIIRTETPLFGPVVQKAVFRI